MSKGREIGDGKSSERESQEQVSRERSKKGGGRELCGKTCGYTNRP
jgi:hypothetical protein